MSFALSPVSILSDEQWKLLFSADLYKKVLEKDASVSAEENNRVRQNSLKYLIVINPNDITVLSHIKFLKEKNSNQINSPFSHHRLTALHIAIMKGRKAVAEEIIKSGAEVNASDAYGWTPLHHAAIAANDLVVLLLRNDAKKDVKTQLDGTYQDILRLTKINKARERAVLYYQSMNASAPEKISIDDISKRLSIEYVDECAWPSKLLYHLWTSTPELEQGRSLSQHEIRTTLYCPIKENIPHIVIREEKFPHSNAINWGVTAGKFIPAYTFMGEYTGKIIKLDKDQGPQELLAYSHCLEDDKDYTISVDAQNTGNWTRYMNDGFPNVIQFDLFNTAGQKCRRVFFAADTNGIQIGEPLLTDYTWHYAPLKWGRYILAEKEKMREFYKNFKHHHEMLVQLFQNLHTGRPDGRISCQNMIEYRALEARLQFPFQTPMAIIDLVFSQTIDPANWAAFLEEEKTKKSGFLVRLLVDENPDHERLYNLLRELEEFNICIEKLIHVPQGAAIAQKTRQQFLSYEDILSVPELIEKLQSLLDFFETINLNIQIDFTEEVVIGLSGKIEMKLIELFPL